MELKKGDEVFALNGERNVVGDICEDPKILEKWVEKGYGSVERICRMDIDEIGYHTWTCQPEKWSKA